MPDGAATRLGVVFALMTAIAVAFGVAIIYREGNLLPCAIALLVPVALLLWIHNDPGKQTFSALGAMLIVSAATMLWTWLGEDLSPFVSLTLTLIGVGVPIAVMLMLSDTGATLALPPHVTRTALLVFILSFAPLTAALVSSEHRDVVQRDQELIREVSQHVQLWNQYIIFEHVDPKHRSELKNRIAVRAKGKTYALSDAHFESVSKESTVRKATEKRGRPKTTVVTREQKEEMRVVLDLDDPAPPNNIVVFSARGPVTICEQEVTLPGEDTVQDPVS